jgi:hypothetical protein
MGAPTAGRVPVVLDVNFPEPILRALDQFVVDVEFVPLRRIDPRLTELDDRYMLLALRQEGFEWLATNNYRMLLNPEELAAILKAHVKVFAIDRAGDDPLKATGALLIDLPGAIRRSTAGKSQVFWSRPRRPVPTNAWELFTTAALRQKRLAGDLYEEVKVSDVEAATAWAEFLPQESD